MPVSSGFTMLHSLVLRIRPLWAQHTQPVAIFLIGYGSREVFVPPIRSKYQVQSGTECTLCFSSVEERSCILTSARPIKGILVLLAAIKSNPTLIHSDISFTAVPERFSHNMPFVIINTSETSVPKSTHFTIIQKTLEEKFYPRRFTSFAYSVGIKGQ